MTPKLESFVASLPSRQTSQLLYWLYDEAGRSELRQLVYDTNLNYTAQTQQRRNAFTALHAEIDRRMPPRQETP